MGRLGIALCGLVLVPPLALAQPVRAPSESVTVTGTKSREVLDGFVQSFAAPARVTGKLARWEDAICPVTVGLKPEFVKFINRRLREIAAQVGAPVNDKTDCRPNIAIAFTPAPQALLDDIRNKQPSLLGYYDNSVQFEKLVMVTRPIQAWYMTATRDLHGKIEVDSGKTIGQGLEIWLPCDRVPGLCLVQLPDAKAYAVTGSRLGDGLRSGLYNVIIVADPTKLLSYEMGSLADYIAMLALTQIASPDACQQLPSIVNMMAAGCETKSSTLTENDTAYLRGLYKMSPDRILGIQKEQVSYQMEQELKGH
jgi:hypothetical protein